MQGLSEDIQSIIDFFDEMSGNLEKVSVKNAQTLERFIPSYQGFIKINESDMEVDNLVFKAYKNNFTEEDEKIWIATKEKKSEMSSKFKNLKINIDTSKRVDPIVEIANIFGKAYSLFATPQIPSGRPNGRISQKTWREYKYIGGKGTGGWAADSAPNGPFAVKAVFNKWEKGVMDIVKDTALRKIFANPNLSINGNPGAGQTLFKFINDMLEDDALKDYDGARRKLLLKYFNIEDDSIMESAKPTKEGKVIKEPANSDQTMLNRISPVNLSKSDLSGYDRSYLILKCRSEGVDYSMVMFILGMFDANNEKVLAFKYQMGGSDLLKYLEGEKLKSPTEEDIIKRLKIDKEINIGFIELKSTIKNDTELTYRAQELKSFIAASDASGLENKTIEIKGAFNLTIGKKDKK
jgi:hypothetical protein